MITQEQANQIFTYKDGKLFWKSDVRPDFIGKEVGTDSGIGYLKCTFKRKQYLVHRIIYLMHHGKLPAVIDHADRNRKNNQIENLRAANVSKNGMNGLAGKPSSTGCRNVTRDTRRNKFSVHLRIKGKSTFLGNYEDLELADLVASEARAKYHGEFAFRH